MRLETYVPSLLTSSLLFAVLGTACLPFAKTLSRPKADPDKLAFRKKYCTDSERAGLREGTPLSELIWEFDCGKGMTRCSAGLDAAAGRLPDHYAQVFLDVLASKPRESGGPEFTSNTCDITSTQRPYILGIDGLGLMHSSKDVQALADFADQYGELNFNDSSTQRRLARALFLTGESSPAEAALMRLLEESPEADTYKPQVLKYLASWKSTSATSFCMDALSTGKGPREACIWYLGEMRHAEALDLIVRRMEDDELEATRALAKLNDERALAHLETNADRKRRPAVRAAALVGMMNLGREESWTEFERMLRGRRLLSSGEETSNISVDTMQHATMEALRLRDGTARDSALQRIASNAAAEPSGSKGWKVPIFSNVALALSGDETAVQRLIALLDHPKKDVRRATVGMIGSDYDRLDGVRIRDASLVDPLVRAWGIEPDVSWRHNVTLAIAFIREGV